MDNTRDIDRTVLRIITVARAACRTSGATKSIPLRHCRRPEDFDVTVRTSQQMLRMPHILTVMVL